MDLPSAFGSLWVADALGAAAVVGSLTGVVLFFFRWFMFQEES